MLFHEVSATGVNAYSETIEKRMLVSRIGFFGSGLWAILAAPAAYSTEVRVDGLHVCRTNVSILRCSPFRGLVLCSASMVRPAVGTQLRTEFLARRDPILRHKYKIYK